MAFSLSPSVDVREYDLSLTVPNLPSSKTGMVLRCDTGPVNKIIPVTNERELVNTFGPPTNNNYQEWFQAWNFLQYSGSLYLVRAHATSDGVFSVENAGLGLANSGVSGLFTNPIRESYAEYYNQDIAELTLEGQMVPAGSRLLFINKNVTSNQDLAVAICSDLALWDKPILNPGNQKFGITDATTAIGEAVLDFSETSFTVGDNVLIDSTSYEITDFDNIYTDEWVNTVDSAGDPIHIVDNATIGDSTAVLSGVPSPPFTPGAEGSTDGTAEITLDGVQYSVLQMIDSTTVEIIGALTVDIIGGVSATVTQNIPIITNILYDVSPALFSFVNIGDKLSGSVPTENSGVLDESLESGTGEVRIFSNFFEYAPNFEKNEFAVIVLQKNNDGKYEQFEDEAYIVSWNETGRDSEGRNIFVDEFFYNNSKVLYVKSDPNSTSPINTAYSPVMDLQNTPESILPSLGGVHDPNGYDIGDISYAWDLFADPEAFDINILVAHPLELQVSATQYSAQIAESRKDAIALIAPYEYDKLVGKSASIATLYLLERYGSQTVYENKIQKVFNSYTSIYGNMKYQYDRFNDVNRWLSVGGDIAGLAANVDRDRDPWWAIAGLDRGKIKNVIKLAFNPNKANRDDLYVNAINPVINIPGEGSGIVFGQKTATAKPSAFDRLNVRRLLIYLEKSIATACRYMLFEFNDEFTRARIRSFIEPFLRDVKGRRGIYDFKVVCDESNNTGEIIDKNGLIVDVYIKPTRVAEFIQVNMKVVRTDANFEEIIGGN